MIKSKFTRGLILGACVTLLSSGVVLADGGGSQPSPLPGQLAVDVIKTDERQLGISAEVSTDSPDAAVSYPAQDQGEINENISQKQREIDKYLFEDHAGEINKKGFNVTHTSPLDEYVEIGITPYSEENAEYLYELFGREMVKVVEGQQAELYNTTAASNGIEAEVVLSNENKQASESSPSKAPLIYAAGACMLLGGGVIVKRKLKSAK
ncbi:hypothetical protein HNQ80_000569 [Anaerosolibacter carboniphilus]|uniref:LPXTG-motif cell wall anchor domain-containing protein n=1 Tax=Anaerosolibacter carboniphilus TaxID=1417629 RepID=A0A841KWC7_9FIRM|nr:hypothetical protein [Anaerosolibacter carboniphilus]MBB6214489.1 hypothetical protein [Anaerosolibacter carboniphilus]